MMINHSEAGGCDLYSKDCTCETYATKEKHVVSFYPIDFPSKHTFVTIDATSGRLTIDSSKFPDAVG